jgi:hypothetical protein
MRRLLLVLVLLAAVVAGLGFCRGWFRLSTGEADGKTSATVTVDRQKIEQDTEKAEEKVQEVGRQLKEKVNAPAAAGKEAAPAGAAGKVGGP